MFFGQSPEHRWEFAPAKSLMAIRSLVAIRSLRQIVFVVVVVVLRKAQVGTLDPAKSLMAIRSLVAIGSQRPHSDEFGVNSCSAARRASQSC